MKKPPTTGTSRPALLAEPAADDTAPLAQVKRRRRPWLWVVGALLVALGSLLAGTVVDMVKDTTAVVVAARDITRGTVITRDDLATVEVHPDALLATVPASEVESLVGSTAQVDLLQGTLVAQGSTGQGAALAAGQVLVGVALTPAQMPSGDLLPGQLVQIVSTPRAGDDVTVGESVISVEATVVDSTVVTDTNMVVVNVAVAQAQAEQIAALSATGRLALLVKGL